MHLQSIGRLAPVLCAALLAGCGGGDSESGSGRTFTAEGEARRIGVLYRAMRDTANVVLPYLQSADALIAMDGSTVGCLASGTAARSYNPGPGSGVEQSLQVQFTDCGESFGVVSGQITVMWNSSADNPSAGTFKPIWFGTFTVDGLTFNVGRPSPITLSYNASSGYRDALIQVRSLSGLQGSDGPAMAMQNVNYRVVDDPASSTFQIVDSRSRIQNPTGRSPAPHAEWRALGTMQAQRVTASEAVAGVGDPLSGGFSYIRGGRTDLRESITSSPQISNGLLSLTVEGQRTKLTDAGQFDWPTLYADAIYDFDGE
jgi:hypothetical protein